MPGKHVIHGLLICRSYRQNIFIKIRHLPHHCCPVLDNVGNIRLASLEYYTMSMHRPIQLMHTCLIISVNIYQWLLEKERKHVQPVPKTTNRHRFRSYTRHYVKVGTYDKIKVNKLYSHCMPIQFMHTCLIISLHGVVLFFGDYRIRRQIYVHM